MKTLTLRSGVVLEYASAPDGLAPGERGLQTGRTRFWVRALGGPDIQDGPWHLTTCRSGWELRQWAALADSLEELLDLVWDS